MHTWKTRSRTKYRVGRALAGAAVLGFAAAGIGPIAARPAGAATTCTTSWKAPLSGFWDAASNWTAGVPKETSAACILVSGDYVVTLRASTKVDSINVGGGSGVQNLRVQAPCKAPAVLYLFRASTIAATGRVTLTNATGPTCDPQFPAIVQQTGALTIRGSVRAIATGNGASRQLWGDIENYGGVIVDDGAFLNVGGTFAHRAGKVTATGISAVAVDGTYVQGEGTTTGSSPAPIMVDGYQLVYSGAGQSRVVVHDHVDITGKTVAGQTIVVEGLCNRSAELSASESWSNLGTIVLRVSSPASCASGVGFVTQPLRTFTNLGTFRVESSVRNRAALLGDFVNRGGFILENLAEPSVSIGSFTNAGGTIQANGSAALHIDEAKFVQGAGTTSGTSPAPVIVARGELEYRGAGAGTVVQYDATTIVGNTAPGQTLKVWALCVSAVLTASANWTNAGTLELIEPPEGTCGAVSDVMIKQSAGTFTNTGTIRVNSRLRDPQINGNVVNRGTIEIAPQTLFRYSGPGFAHNAGTIQASNASAFVVDGGTFRQGGGTTTGASAAPVIVNGGEIIYTGTGASRIVQHGPTILKGNIAAGQTIVIEAPCNNAANLVADANWTNRGTMAFVGGSGPGCTAAPTFVQAGMLFNEGTIVIGPGGASAKARISGDMVNNGLIDISSGAVVEHPWGHWTLGIPGTIQTAVGMTTGYGAIRGGGPIALNGTLKIVTGNTPAVGTVMPIIDSTGASSISGHFAQIIGQSVGDGHSYSVGTGPKGVVLTVK